MKQSATTIAIIAAALVLGICTIVAAHTLKPTPNTVTVRGLCEREVMADRAIYPICYKETGDDLQNVYASVKTKNAIIVDFLKSKGFTDSEITIAAPKLTDRQVESYGQYTGRYVINSVVSVCTDKVKEVIALQGDLSQLLDQGIGIGSGNDWETPAVYELTKLNDLKPEMIEEANKNARTAADQFANDSGSKIGRITEATQGLFSIENRDANTPYMKKVRVVNTVTYKLR